MADGTMRTTKQQGQGQARSMTTGRFTPKPMGGDMLALLADGNKGGRDLILGILRRTAPTAARVIEVLSK